MQYDLKKMIKNEFDKGTITQTKLASMIGYVQSAPLSQFLRKQDREMDSFMRLLKLVNILFPEIKNKILGDYLKTLDPNGQNARYALEFAFSNGMKELIDHLIISLLSCSNAESQEWGYIYSLLRQSNSKEKSIKDVIAAINKYRFKTDEMYIFSKIVLMYCYYDLGLFNMVEQLSFGLDSEISLLKEEYIRKNYFSRLGLLMISICLHKNDVRNARYHANLVIENSFQESIVALAYHRLGDTYTFENYEIAVENITKSITLYEKLGKKHHQWREAKRSLTFVQNYWGKEPTYLEYESKESSDIHEICAYLISNKKIDEAKNLVYNIDLTNLTNYQKGFHYYFRGLADRNENNFYESIYYFKEAGDYFYRNLPINELRKLGVNEIALKAFSN